MSGCVSAPEVQMVPDLVRGDAPSFFGNEPRGQIGQWWRYIDDDGLHRMIDTGLAGSPSPKVAMARLAQAESDLAVAQSTLWPSLQGQASRKDVYLSGQEPDTRSDLGSLELGWDFGLWGKRRLEIENARQFRDQRWFELKAVELALSTTIAETYYQIIELKAQEVLLTGQIGVSKDLERLIDARFRLGQASASELYQQREQTTLLVQFKLLNEARHEALEKSLDVLLGNVPDTVPLVTSLELPDTPELIALGTSEDLIRSRADIRARYARLRQVAARSGISFAERLPTLQVTASLTSLADRALSSVPSRSNSRRSGLELDLAAPIFAGGELRAREKQAQFALEEERERYLELWLTALEEVSSLRWKYQQQKKVMLTLAARRGYAQRALDAARNRFVLGDQNYLDVLIALRRLQEAERSMVSERRQLISLWIRASETIGQPMCNLSPNCEQNWQY
jgi:NodT family efflux transporter outer membrane factor (OMF) lipoprotein